LLPIAPDRRVDIKYKKGMVPAQAAIPFCLRNRIFVHTLLKALE
jgi:hypothetical protein